MTTVETVFALGVLAAFVAFALGLAVISWQTDRYRQQNKRDG